MITTKTECLTNAQSTDHNYVSTIYQKIVEKMAILDQLNAQYKVKQEAHFLKTFMNVIQKMGNDLILAQEAYRNVDLEARKDNYCLLIAQELSFFKAQTYNLRQLLTEKEQDNKRLRIEIGTLQTELISVRQGFQSKVKESMKLRYEIQGLKKQIKYLMDPSKYSIFKFTNPESGREMIQIAESSKNKSLSMTNYLEDGSLDTRRFGNRVLMTNSHSRRKNISMTLEIKPESNRENQGRFTMQEVLQLDLGQQNRKKQVSTNSSFRKKLISQHINRTVLRSYDPSLQP